jgi:hypothetical protein
MYVIPLQVAGTGKSPKSHLKLHPSSSKQSKPKICIHQFMATLSTYHCHFHQDWTIWVAGLVLKFCYKLRTGSNAAK